MYFIDFLCMIRLQMRVTNIREILLEKYNSGDFVIDKSGVKMVEITGASFEADEPCIFGELNHDYIARELAWYESKSCSVYDIPGEVPKIWLKCADEHGMIHSNYGYLAKSHENHNQFWNTLKQLVASKETRRAVMIYTRPTMHLEFDRRGMSDFICTNTVQYLIRNNKMETVVQMRSNDAWAGYRNDFSWQQHIQSQLIEAYNIETNSSIEPGKITWQAGSLHVYERQFYLLERCNTNSNKA